MYRSSAAVVVFTTGAAPRTHPNESPQKVRLVISPSTHSSREAARNAASPLLSSHRKRRTQLGFEQWPILVGRIFHPWAAQVTQYPVSFNMGLNNQCYTRGQVTKNGLYRLPRRPGIRINEYLYNQTVCAYASRDYCRINLIKSACLCFAGEMLMKITHCKAIRFLDK